MKIGIITQPLDINYGGLLQNYALQQVLMKLGHEAYTINRFNKPRLRIKYTVRQLIKKLLGLPRDYLYWELFKIRKHCREFVNRNIKTTEMFRTQDELYRIVRKYKFDGYISGSDQVWRPCFSENIYNDFLDFCQNKKGIKRIAYSASFGVSEWEFNEEQTARCGRLVKLFDAVSVREDSGVVLCENHWGISATHVLDPTLLLEKEDYIKIVEEYREQKSVGDLFCYILDENEKIDNAIRTVGHKLSMKDFKVGVKYCNQLHKKGENISNYIIPAPTKWLRAFMDAKMVFTDSFHGCVFSIIFNKPFWVIGNMERGNARFDSLLKLFELENRRISLEEIGQVDLNSAINWDKVIKIKEDWQDKSFKFLRDNL